MWRERIEKVKHGAGILRLASGEVRSAMLGALANAIDENAERLLIANERDRAEHEASLEPAMAQRLGLSSEKLSTLSSGLRTLAERDDPVGALLSRTQLDIGLLLDKVTTPLGVVGVIFESRPDVFFQVLGLALRTGNGVVLKGGREATHSNRAMFEVAREALASQGFQNDWFCLLEGREAVAELLTCEDLVDLIIPRGSNEFVRHIQGSSRIPVLGHASGVCHIYVHPSASVDRAIQVILDAKTQYPAACNSVETVLIDVALSPSFLEALGVELSRSGVRTRGCPRAKEVLCDAEVIPDDEWSLEYSSLTVAIKVVDGVEDAIDHINKYGSHHTDAILAHDPAVIERFLSAVDSASVFANCSTRFADGYRFGFGAEVGIGTGKIHARGPVGLEGLLTYKYLVRGEGHCVASYSGQDAKNFQFRAVTIDP